MPFFAYHRNSSGSSFGPWVSAVLYRRNRTELNTTGHKRHNRQNYRESILWSILAHCQFQLRCKTIEEMPELPGACTESPSGQTVLRKRVEEVKMQCICVVKSRTCTAIS